MKRQLEWDILHPMVRIGITDGTKWVDHNDTLVTCSNY